MSELKKQLRFAYKNKRDEFMKAEGNRFLCENAFLNSRFYSDFKNFLVYNAIGSEPSTIELITRAINDNKNVYLPRIDGRIIRFFSVTDINELKPGKFGVFEPVSQCEYDCSEAVCIVPGLSFDNMGNRLGYGGGYYDRFLAECNNLIKVGFCTSCNFSSELPACSYDIPMDYIFIDDKLLFL